MSSGKYSRDIVRSARRIHIPLVYAGVALTLGFVVPRLEARFLPDFTAGIGANAAIAVLSAIASGTLPLTGLVFSMAFLMVQFSTIAYSPRLVGWQTGSSVLRHSLGFFIATFLYALAAMAWVDREGSGKVPLLTIVLAILLLLASVSCFAVLVHQLAVLQISRVLQYAGDRGRDVIERDYDLLGSPEDASKRATEELPAQSQVVTHRGGPATIQALDIARLVHLAERENVVIASAWAVGDTLVEGMALVRVHGGTRAIDERKLRKLVRLGTERTFEQDPKYAIRLLVDIAIKALSPAINDPTTAVQALDQVEDLMLRLGQRSLDAGRCRDARGKVRLVVPVPQWEDFLILAFDEIRFYGTQSIQVMRRMRALLQSLIEHVPPERQPALRRYLERVDNGIRRSFPDLDDQKDALEEDRQGLGLARERRRV